MEKVILNAEIRKETGKAKAKKLRQEEIVPAVIYNDGKESMNLKLKYRDLYNVLNTAAGENVLITLKIKGDKKTKERTCIIKEIQRDPLKENVIHVDLKEVSLTEEIKIKIPVHTHGEPEGVVKDEGVLDHPLWEIEAECLPTDIPEKIEVEVAHMKIGDTIYVKDLKVPPKVKILTDPELTVVSVVPPAKEEIVPEVPAEGIEEPEVIAKGKKEEEAIEGEEEEKEKKPKKEEAPPKEKKKE
ncbi:MAG: 50S ribosomal protein L25 [Candidatus Omnitrophota bacterium]|nr:MAG: 50S ribosomal protein L25 [Candidatus Omnitrophota bacterium]